MRAEAQYLSILIIGALLVTLCFVPFVYADGVCFEGSESNSSEFAFFVKELFEVVPTIGFRYGAKDSQGYGLDTIKIVENPEGGYLGVYHHLIGGTFQVRLANSTDLLSWTYIRTIESGASQPTIARSPNGAYIVAFEKEGSSSHLKIHYYSNLSALIYGPPAFTIDLPRILSPEHEGTPNIYNITIKDSTMNVCIGFHYDNITANADEVAIGWLKVPPDNPSKYIWKTEPLKEYNDKLRILDVKGNIGDRDYAQVFGRNFTLQEANLLPRQYESVNRNQYWASWRIFLYDHKDPFYPLNIKTHKGSTSFGNPTFTFLKSPNGKDCIVVTYFLFSEGAKEGEAGELIFYKEFETEQFNLTYKGMTYSLKVTSNSTISNFVFNESERSINFNVNGPDNSRGYCIAELPNTLTQDLWKGNYTVLIDNKPCQFENWTTPTNTYIYVYLHTFRTQSDNNTRIPITYSSSTTYNCGAHPPLALKTMAKQNKVQITTKSEKTFLKCILHALFKETEAKLEATVKE